LRLLYELQIVAAQNPERYGRHLQSISLRWLTAATRSFTPDTRSEPLATLCIAVFDGLLFELINTGDRARLSKALDAFIAMAQASASIKALDGEDR
jgi:hypothetical protein